MVENALKSAQDYAEESYAQWRSPDGIHMSMSFMLEQAYLAGWEAAMTATQPNPGAEIESKD